MKPTVALSLTFVTLATLVGCSQTLSPTLPDPLRVSVIPHLPAEALRDTYLPLLSHLESALGVRAILVMSASPGDLGEKFHRGEVDLALFESVAFVEAERSDAAVPLVMRIRDRHVSSALIARPGLGGDFPKDFRGLSLAYAPEESTAGFLMARQSLQSLDIRPEDVFHSVVRLNGDDEVIASVGEGRSDLGMVDGQELRLRLARGAAHPAWFRQVWESPHHGGRVWASRGALHGAPHRKIREAFLSLDNSNPEHRQILNQLGTRAFVTATRADFDPIRLIVTGVERYSGR